MKLCNSHYYKILCEDKLTQCYIRRFLTAQGISGRRIHSLPLPAAGCGEQYVRQQYPKYLKALRTNNFNSNILIVAIDADTKTFKERKKQLEESCIMCGIPSRTKKDKLLIFIPKRNIEKWVKYFYGESVDEETDCSHFLNGHESDCYKAADNMSDLFSKENFDSTLTALQDAYEEYKALIKLINT